ncbi:hypothetical protein [Escherichia coli]|uniref:hypothetical protein n=1 Tax=Escherichia coli TaxID=562 RepID=UPI0039806CC6
MFLKEVNRNRFSNVTPVITAIDAGDKTTWNLTGTGWQKILPQPKVPQALHLWGTNHF